MPACDVRQAVLPFHHVQRPPYAYPADSIARLPKAVPVDRIGVLLYQTRFRE